ncbi:pyridoxal-phosphate dependent enzyme [Nocardia asteroides]
MRYDHITELIGNTPLLRLDPAVHGLANVDLYAKLESHNPFGSVKDRVAWGMLRERPDGDPRARPDAHRGVQREHREGAAGPRVGVRHRPARGDQPDQGARGP